MKTDFTKLTADWSQIGNRPPWDAVSSAELAKVLSVHLQTISNWQLRGHLPPTLPHRGKLQGNKNFYRISAIRAWLQSQAEEDIIRDWIAADIGVSELTLLEATYLINTIYRSNK